MVLSKSEALSAIWRIKKSICGKAEAKNSIWRSQNVTILLKTQRYFAFITNQYSFFKCLILMFIFQACDVNQNQIIVAKELDFIVKNEPKDDEEWYVNEAVNICADCAEKDSLIDKMAKDLTSSKEKITELETAIKLMKNSHAIEIEDLKMKVTQSNNENDGLYEVEKLLDHKKVGNKQQFLVKWQNYDESQNCWVDRKNLHCKDILQKYLKSKNLT